MARPLRIQYPNAVYHIMNRGLGRRDTFLDENDRSIFLETLDEAWRRWKFEVYAYCLMGNHYHLCLKTPEAKLSRVMRHLNGVYTQRFNRAHRMDGPLFRGRYKSILIEEDDYLGQVVRYIHLNPVEAGLVKSPELYRWSSHKDYLSRQAPRWLSTETMLTWFGTKKKFHEYVQEGNEDALESVYEGKRWPPILGGEEFIEKIHSKPQPAKEHTRRERQYLRPTAQRVLEVVADEMRVPLCQLVEGRRGVRNEARKVALWALREFGDHTYSQISELAGLGSEKTVGWACQEVLGKAKADSRTRKQLLRIAKRISQPEI